MSRRTRIGDLLKRPTPGGTVTVCGWVRSLRASGDVAFISINDGSNLDGMQLVLERDRLPSFDDFCTIGTGAALRASGELVTSPAAGQQYELQVQELSVVGQADSAYPLQKNGIPSSTCAASPTCGPAPTPLARSSGYAHDWPRQFTVF